MNPPSSNYAETKSTLYKGVVGRDGKIFQRNEKRYQERTIGQDLKQANNHASHLISTI
jgi:hypothetical protein